MTMYHRGIVPFRRWVHYVPDISGRDAIPEPVIAMIAFVVDIQKAYIYSGTAWELITDAEKSAFISVTAAVDLDALAARSRPYKVYTAILTQTGTDAPTEVVLENTFTDTLAWVYDGVGLYRLESAGEEFIENKTEPIHVAFFNGAIRYIDGYRGGGDSEFIIETFSDTSGTNADELLLNTVVSIKVYD